MNQDRLGGTLLTATRPEPTSNASAFVLCPIAVPMVTPTACHWEQVYRMAYERAQAVVRPSILERLSANLAN